jgi:crotonobetainyl-CoA:carnitine CoA-transferase CaiB-like acyl-CoA transferase
MNLPLAGTRVLDLGQFIVMPFCTQWLAWLGAEVIVIESRRRMTSRTAPPFVPGLEGDLNASGYYNFLYGSKKSCAIDMTTPAGRHLVRRLAEISDIVVDNFSTGVLEKLGIGYETIMSSNPSVIMASCGAFGRTGPLSHARGLHSAVNLFSGVADATGYPDGAPRILGGVLPDPLGGTYAMFAILSALYHRRRTGEGQFIDVAMYEAMMTLIPEAVLDLTMNGNEPTRTGNRDRQKAPHGIYRCRENDTWVAIAVDGEADWAAFCEATGMNDPRFIDAPNRLAHIAALDEQVESWTRTFPTDEIVEKLQAAGIAAGPIRRADQLLDDPQLQARGMVITTDHPVAGQRRQLGLPWQMDSLAVSYRPAPLYSAHTHEILTGLLSLGEAEYVRLEADGVLS